MWVRRKRHSVGGVGVTIKTPLNISPDGVSIQPMSAGDIADVSPQIAKSLIDAGLAEPYDADADEQAFEVPDFVGRYMIDAGLLVEAQAPGPDYDGPDLSIDAMNEPLKKTRRKRVSRKAEI